MKLLTEAILKAKSPKPKKGKGGTIGGERDTLLEERNCLECKHLRDCYRVFATRREYQRESKDCENYDREPYNIIKFWLLRTKRRFWRAVWIYGNRLGRYAGRRIIAIAHKQEALRRKDL